MNYHFPKIPFLLSLLFCFASVFLFFSLYSKIKNNNLESDRVFVQWQNEYQKRENIKSLNDFLENTIEDRILLNGHFAQSSDAVKFLDTVEGLGPQTGAKAEVLVINVPDDNTGLYVEVKAFGTFGAVYKFIKLLESSPYEVEIISMDMSNGSSFDSLGKQSSGWSINLKIKLSSFIK